ncbi:hypothetical protein AAFF_G00340020 [Aldrovandia affinis]|uniref:Uncharacterized protein n=1 Tax=Aldrovandia affinis TaxID=143900 RepID=A0AAD7SKG5_9TELE|nr:hypothetical protein AAFF_G00340020 [Aldrovandia affinis]
MLGAQEGGVWGFGKGVHLIPRPRALSLFIDPTLVSLVRQAPDKSSIYEPPPQNAITLSYGLSYESRVGGVGCPSGPPPLPANGLSGIAVRKGSVRQFHTSTPSCLLSQPEPLHPPPSRRKSSHQACINPQTLQEAGSKVLPGGPISDTQAISECTFAKFPLRRIAVGLAM